MTVKSSGMGAIMEAIKIVAKITNMSTHCRLHSMESGWQRGGNFT